MTLGIIGGSGLYALEGVEIEQSMALETPFGEPSDVIVRANWGGSSILFLARHGSGHTIPPHLVNYRANLSALRQAGAGQVLAVYAVGGISAAMKPGVLAVPDQLIDYTWGRESTLFEEGFSATDHVDFSYPYDAQMRQALLLSGERTKYALVDGGCMGVTQGPRLESAAEVLRCERDGCDLVNMTAMPEAGIARELGLPFAAIALVVNWAAGKGSSVVSMNEIYAELTRGMGQVSEVLRNYTVGDQN